MEQLERQIESVKDSHSTYLKVHEENAELHTDDINEDKELNSLDQHEEAVSKTPSKSFDLHQDSTFGIYLPGIPNHQPEN